MITIEEMRKYSKRVGYNIGQIEKDYLQHHVLSSIEMISGNSLVFKGGTCLQKVFALDRFSEDLDFTLNRGPRDAISVKGTAERLETIGFPCELRSQKGTKASSTVRLLVEGPLFNGRPNSRCSITINVSTRGDLECEPLVKRLVPIYNEITPYAVYHMSLEEMMAEKIRALVTRDMARDLYDLQFLLQKDVKPDRDLVDRKLSYYEIKLTRKLLRDGIRNKKGIWQMELRPLLVRKVPDYAGVSKEVLRGLDQLVR